MTRPKRQARGTADKPAARLTRRQAAAQGVTVPETVATPPDVARGRRRKAPTAKIPPPPAAANTPPNKEDDEEEEEEEEEMVAEGAASPSPEIVTGVTSPAVAMESSMGSGSQEFVSRLLGEGNDKSPTSPVAVILESDGSVAPMETPVPVPRKQLTMEEKMRAHVARGTEMRMIRNQRKLKRQADREATQDTPASAAPETPVIEESIEAPVETPVEAPLTPAAHDGMMSSLRNTISHSANKIWNAFSFRSSIQMPFSARSEPSKKRKVENTDNGSEETAHLPGSNSSHQQENGQSAETESQSITNTIESGQSTEPVSPTQTTAEYIKRIKAKRASHKIVGKYRQRGKPTKSPRDDLSSEQPPSKRQRTTVTDLIESTPGRYMSEDPENERMRSRSTSPRAAVPVFQRYQPSPYLRTRSRSPSPIRERSSSPLESIPTRDVDVHDPMYLPMVTGISINRAKRLGAEIRKKQILRAFGKLPLETNHEKMQRYANERLQWIIDSRRKRERGEAYEPFEPNQERELMVALDELPPYEANYRALFCPRLKDESIPQDDRLIKIYIQPEEYYKNTQDEHPTPRGRLVWNENESRFLHKDELPPSDTEEDMDASMQSIGRTYGVPEDVDMSEVDQSIVSNAPEGQSQIGHSLINWSQCEDEDQDVGRTYGQPDYSSSESSDGEDDVEITDAPTQQAPGTPKASANNVGFSESWVVDAGTPGPHRPNLFATPSTGILKTGPKMQYTPKQPSGLRFMESIVPSSSPTPYDATFSDASFATTPAFPQFEYNADQIMLDLPNLNGSEPGDQFPPNTSLGRTVALSMGTYLLKEMNMFAGDAPNVAGFWDFDDRPASDRVAFFQNFVVGST
jgi:hypothetical protein